MQLPAFVNFCHSLLEIRLNSRKRAGLKKASIVCLRYFAGGYLCATVLQTTADFYCQFLFNWSVVLEFQEVKLSLPELKLVWAVDAAGICSARCLSLTHNL